MSRTRKPGAERRQRFSPLLWISSLGAIAALSLGITGTLSQFVAQITNPNNNVETTSPSAFGFSESLVVNGQPQTPACAVASAGASVNCDAINKYGEVGTPAEPIAPGQERRTTVRLQNTAEEGGLLGLLTLSVAPCTQVPAVGEANPANDNVAAGDLCGTMKVDITCSGAASQEGISLPPVTLADFEGSHDVDGIPPGGYVDCTFTTVYPSETTNPDLQGITTSQPMTWTFAQET